MGKSVKLIFLAVLAFGCCCCVREKIKEVETIHEVEKEYEKVATSPATWIAQDALGRIIEPVPVKDKSMKDRKVGIFYFLWLGSHGYDDGNNTIPALDYGVAPPRQDFDVRSPYDIQKLLDENKEHPDFGPNRSFHHWGEPYFDYYVSNDEWIIRKHAQMLNDAGVDVIIIDATNGVLYFPTVLMLCKVWGEIRADGNQTPQIAFMLSTKANETSMELYQRFYALGLYKDLWFRWLDKPLLLCWKDELAPELLSFFTVRDCWFNNGDWFGDGKDKWCWGDFYPQKYGWHENSTIPEEMSVAAALLPMYNVGRSFHQGQQPTEGNYQSSMGFHFAEQFDYALEKDPQFIFITGWNEWVAQAAKAPFPLMYCGKQIPSNTTYFVDNYNHEYSRDIEPLKDDFGDNYYYQMVDYIRKFKGGEELQVDSVYSAMDIAGTMDCWDNISLQYADDYNDITSRAHFGWGRIGLLSNYTGRNDILLSKVATDGVDLFFYVRCNRDISPYTDDKWMRLFLDVKNSSVHERWEGFNFAIGIEKAVKDQMILSKSLGDWNWTSVTPVFYKQASKEMMLSIPLKSLGLKMNDEFVVDFKWIDNAVANGDIRECSRDGDSAPNGRFRYRYQFKLK